MWNEVLSLWSSKARGRSLVRLSRRTRNLSRRCSTSPFIKEKYHIAGPKQLSNGFERCDLHRIQGASSLSSSSKSFIFRAKQGLRCWASSLRPSRSPNRCQTSDTKSAFSAVFDSASPARLGRCSGVPGAKRGQKQPNLRSASPV